VFDAVELKLALGRLRFALYVSRLTTQFKNRDPLSLRDVTIHQMSCLPTQVTESDFVAELIPLEQFRELEKRQLVESIVVETERPECELAELTYVELLLGAVAVFFLASSGQHILNALAHSSRSHLSLSE